MSGLFGLVVRREEGDFLSWDIGCKKVRLVEEEFDLGRVVVGEVFLMILRYIRLNILDVGVKFY